MSDFLDRLIERSFGLSPVVRPRLPSLFEPPGPDAAAEPEPAAEAEEPARASVPRAAIPHAPEPSVFADEPAARPPARPSQTATTLPPPIESAESAPPEPRPRADASPPRPSRREAQTPGPPPFEPGPQPAHTRPEVEHVARAFTPPRAAAEEHATAAVNLTPPEHGAAPSKSSETPTRREAVAQDGANASGQLSELGRQVEGLRQQVERTQLRPAAPELRVETRPVEGEHTIERVREVQARAQAPVFVRPRATQRAAPLSEAHERADVPTPEPTVNVTIGRIEVRAAQTAEPSARQERREQPPAAMSLREYLRKRSGGHSR